MTVERATPGAEDLAELAAPHLARYLMAADLTAGRRVLDAGAGAVYGRPRFNLGICRRPVSGGSP